MVSSRAFSDARFLPCSVVDLASELIDGAMSENVAVPPRVVNNEVNAGRRTELYGAGVAFINEVLIQDLLKAVVPFARCGIPSRPCRSEQHRGVHLRIFRQHNKTGFVKGFSDNTPGFSKGYSKVEKVMSSLFVKKLTSGHGSTLP